MSNVYKLTITVKIDVKIVKFLYFFNNFTKKHKTEKQSYLQEFSKLARFGPARIRPRSFRMKVLKK